MGSFSCCSLKVFPCKGAFSSHSVWIEGLLSKVASKCKGVML